jgi:hypothetical protein
MPVCRMLDGKIFEGIDESQRLMSVKEEDTCMSYEEDTYL